MILKISTQSQGHQQVTLLNSTVTNRGASLSQTWVRTSRLSAHATTTGGTSLITSWLGVGAEDVDLAHRSHTVSPRTLANLAQT